VVVQLQPGEQLGLDVDVTSTNVIQDIDRGLIADLNTVYPGSVEVGDKILEVEGKTGNAVEQIRSWVQDATGEAPRNLRLSVARRAVSLEGQPTGWSFSVMVRVHPGQSLGAAISTDTNFISEINDGGAIASLNKSHPGSLQVGDRVMTVDGVPCPIMGTAAELETWFQGRKNFSKDIPRDLRLTVLRPAELVADVTLLPPYEYCLVDVGTSFVSVNEQINEQTRDGQTLDLPQGASTKPPSPQGTLSPRTLTSKAAALDTFVDKQAVTAPQPRRWYQIFTGQCCAPAVEASTEQQVARVTSSPAA
jgi:hypothetical protein